MYKMKNNMTDDIASVSDVELNDYGGLIQHSTKGVFFFFFAWVPLRVVSKPVHNSTHKA